MKALHPRGIPLSRLTNSFLDDISGFYLKELQRAWEADPSSINKSWDNFCCKFLDEAALSTGLSSQTIQESMQLLLVVNNQVAFTMNTRAGRSSPYCTNVAKALNAHIFHVDGEDHGAVIRVCEFAIEWRQTFHSDMVVELICYR
ncbi:hypothetical protein GUJ93_ZPchr0008g13612 [Zizania palustris]|uniref:Dehydrogenase E1 component domain-containing protein n=1 Tax=Zizania palustris TaxID=103762 RepID=A0A8J5RC97_ZIZPA|nr:hypothetical protein GUJ93_ZPchr0008g13612 [Zizania palustris]